MAEQVPDEVKRERIEQLVDVVQRVAAERNAGRVGMVEEVLVEGPSRTEPELLRGRTRRNTTVNFTGDAAAGDLVVGRDRERDVDDARRRAARARRRLRPCSSSASSGRPRAASRTSRRPITELIPAEVVSADAMQVYDGLPILTNRSPHPERLVGIWPLSHVASVGEYAPLAHAAIDEILADGRTPVVVGGTGLYFRAALAELELPPAPAPGARERWERLYDEDGAAAAHARLAELDPTAAERVHRERPPACRSRARARGGGRSRSYPCADALFGGAWRHPTLLVGLDVPKAELERTDRGTDAADVRRRRRGRSA